MGGFDMYMTVYEPRHKVTALGIYGSPRFGKALFSETGDPAVAYQHVAFKNLFVEDIYDTAVSYQKIRGASSRCDIDQTLELLAAFHDKPPYHQSIRLLRRRQHAKGNTPPHKFRYPTDGVLRYRGKLSAGPAPRKEQGRRYHP
jgi:hypothetical protein